MGGPFVMLCCRRLAALALGLVLATPALASPADRVTITRDGWGIAHVHGHSDADAVHGMVYAQAEDGFPRIERNYPFSIFGESNDPASPHFADQVDRYANGDLRTVYFWPEDLAGHVTAHVVLIRK